MKAENLTKLAEAVGINRSQFTRWQKKPGFPKKGSKGYDVAEVQKWIEANITRRQPRKKLQDDPAKNAGDTDWGDMASKRAQKLEEEIEKLRLHNEQKRGQLIDRKTVLESFERIGEFIRKTILNSGLDKIQQDKIFEKFDTEQSRLLSAIIEDIESELPETDET